MVSSNCSFCKNFVCCQRLNIRARFLIKKIIKVIDKRNSLGEVNTAHIMAYKNKPGSREKIYNLYDNLVFYHFDFLNEKQVEEIKKEVENISDKNFEFHISELHFFFIYFKI